MWKNYFQNFVQAPVASKIMKSQKILGQSDKWFKRVPELSPFAGSNKKYENRPCRLFLSPEPDQPTMTGLGRTAESNNMLSHFLT